MFNIYSYKNKQEYQYIENNYNVISCSLTQLLNNYDYSDYDYIDITLFIEHINNNPHNKIFLNNIEYYLHNGAKAIIHENNVNLALNLYYTLFDSEIKLAQYIEFPKTCETEIFDIKREIIYYYETNELTSLIKYCNIHKIPFFDINIKQYHELIRNEIFSSEQIIDITSYLDNKNRYTIDYILKLFINQNITFIYKKSSYSEELKFHFKEKQHISNKYPDFEKEEDHSNPVVKIIDLNDEQFNEVNEKLNTQLIGHTAFKEDLYNELNNFNILNAMDMKKIFSIFILGESGLGKTEIARIINRSLNKNRELLKINFGNYTSKDSLNSLIGSPRGYIGSEDGELSIKLNKPHAGIILCDEFEKADNKIVSFFLELLEEGKFTDSQLKEYDLNGYIIIFTSNLNKKEFATNIPQEFQSRIDLITHFELHTLQEKREFVSMKIKEISEKIKKNPQYQTLNLDNFEFNYDLNTSHNLRDIERELINQIINEIRNKIKTKKDFQK